MDGQKWTPSDYRIFGQIELKRR